MNNYHYEAFISYNHNPEDIRIANMLQQKLEHFRIPKNIKSKTSKGEIHRIFLDRGELEVAGDLNEKIMRAIENSEYLIVICSEKAKTSPWIKKEIDYFLKFHDKDQILTVVTDGEPADVVPEILRYRERTDENGTLIREEVEPLSCDYRGDLKKANRSELPRLVSAIIGCRYDDLVQRQRHYRMQRLMILLAVIAAVLISALGYFIWSNHQIRASLEKSQIEESKTLALQSEMALNDGDRIGAIEDALKALPSPKEERPITSEAVLALSKALDIYKPPSAERVTAVREYKGSEELGSATLGQVWQIDAFDNKDKGKRYFMTIYTKGSVWIWDADTGKPLMHDMLQKMYKNGVSFTNGQFSSDGHAVLMTVDTIYYLDVAQGKCLWKQKNGGTYNSGIPINEFNLIPDNVLITTDNLFVPVQIGEGDGAYWEIQKRDLKTGKVEKTITVPDQAYYLCASADGRQIAYGCSSVSGDEDIVYCMTEDMKDPRELQHIGYLTGLHFKGKRNLAICGLDQRPDLNDNSQFSFVDMNTEVGRYIHTEATEKTVVLSYWDTQNARALWEQNFKDVFSGTPSVYWNSDDGLLEDGIPCTAGDKLKLFSQEGKQQFDVAFGSPVLTYLNYNSDAKRVSAVLYDGGYGLYSIDTNRIQNVSGQFHGPVEAAVREGSSVFTISMDTSGKGLSQRLLEYQYAGSDSRWKDYEKPLYDRTAKGAAESKTEEVERLIIPYKGSFIEISKRSNPKKDLGDQYSGRHILRRGCESGRILWQNTYFEDMDSYGLTYAGIDEEKELMYFQCLDVTYLNIAAIDLKDGSVKTMQIEDKDLPGISTEVEGLNGFRDGKLYKVVKRSENGDDYQMIFYLSLLTIDPQEQKILDMADILKLPEGEYGNDFATVRPIMDVEKERLLFYGDGSIHLYGLDGKEVTVIKDLAYEPAGLGFVNPEDKSEEIVALEPLSDKVILHRYDVSSGEEAAQVTINEAANSYGEPISVTQMSDGDLLAVIGSKAFVLDGATWERKADVMGYKGYNPKTQQFYLGTEESENGHVPYCSLDEMIRMGREATGQKD